MTPPRSTDDQLAEWIAVVDRRAKRHGIVDRSLRGDEAGLLTVPLRFGFKVLEVGPIAATRLAISVVAIRLGRR